MEEVAVMVQFIQREIKYVPTPGSPFLHRRQLDPAVESGIIAADKICAVLSWKNKRNQRRSNRLWQFWVPTAARKAVLKQAYISEDVLMKPDEVLRILLCWLDKGRESYRTKSPFFLLTGVLFVHSADRSRGCESTNAYEFELP